MEQNKKTEKELREKQKNLDADTHTFYTKDSQNQNP